MFRTLVVCAVAYAATLGAATAGLFWWRSAIVAEYGTPEALQAWRAWKAETERMNAERPVGPERRAVGIDEPPALVLMRDRFAPIVLGSILTISFLFAFVAFVTVGLLRSPSLPAERSPPTSAP